MHGRWTMDYGLWPWSYLKFYFAIDPATIGHRSGHIWPYVYQPKLVIFGHLTIPKLPET